MHVKLGEDSTHNGSYSALGELVAYYSAPVDFRTVQ